MKKIIFLISITLCQFASAENLLSVFEEAYKTNPKIASNLKKMDLNSYNNLDSFSAFLPKVDLYANMEMAETETEIEGNSAFAGTTTTDSKPVGYGASAEQTLFTGGANIATYNATRKATAAENITVNYEIGGILIDIASAYIDVLQARKQLDFFIKSEDILKNNAKMAEVKFKNGSAPKTDLLRAKASYAQSRAQLTEANGNLNIALQKYESLVGKSADDKLTMPVVKGYNYGNFEDYYEDVLKFNPSLKSAALYKESTRGEIYATNARFFIPKIVARASYSQSDNNSIMGMTMNQTESKIGLYASIPLINRGLSYNDARKAYAKNEIAYLNEKDATNEVALHAQQSWEIWKTAKEVKKAAEEKVEALGLAIKGIQLEAKIGRKSSIDVLDTQEEYIQSELELLNAEKQEIISYFQMQQLVGKMNIDDLKGLKYE